MRHNKICLKLLLFCNVNRQTADEPERKTNRQTKLYKVASLLKETFIDRTHILKQFFSAEGIIHPKKNLDYVDLTISPPNTPYLFIFLFLVQNEKIFLSI